MFKKCQYIKFQIKLKERKLETKYHKQSFKYFFLDDFLLLDHSRVEKQKLRDDLHSGVYTGFNSRVLFFFNLLILLKFNFYEINFLFLYLIDLVSLITTCKIKNM